ALAPGLLENELPGIILQDHVANQTVVANGSGRAEPGGHGPEIVKREENEIADEDGPIKEERQHRKDRERQEIRARRPDSPHSPAPVKMRGDYSRRGVPAGAG